MPTALVIEGAGEAEVGAHAAVARLRPSARGCADPTGRARPQVTMSEELADPATATLLYPMRSAALPTAKHPPPVLPWQHVPPRADLALGNMSRPVPIWRCLSPC